jgi:zinc transport system substrate-binding protein
METFIDTIAGKYPSLKTVELASGIPLIKDHHGVNGHVWVNPSNALVMVANCAEAMARHDPSNAPRYRENAGNYSVRLTRLKQEMHETLRAYRGAKIVTFHEAFPYFAREFGLEFAAVIESEPGSEPSTRELARTVAVIRKHRVRALFAEPQYPSTAAETIARETGTAVHVLDPASSGEDSYDAYIETMRRNLNVLKKALNE